MLIEVCSTVMCIERDVYTCMLHRNQKDTTVRDIAIVDLHARNTNWVGKGGKH
jgi:hypothetical protein